jgi:uncharacterized protein
VRTLLDAGADVNAVISADKRCKWPVIVIAAETGKKDMVELLIEKGANVELTEGDSGFTALMHAAACGHVGVVQALLTKGRASIDAIHEGDSALTLASANGKMQAVIALLDEGSAVNLQPYASALHEACGCGHFEVAKELIYRGADVNTLDETHGFSVLEYTVGCSDL